MAAQRRYRSLVSDSTRWERLALRPGDIIISPPAKCGTTWMQMLCALVVLDTATFPRPLTEISPWLDATTYDVEATLAALEAQTHRRFIKTHTPLDGLPADEQVTYLCVGRDPRDAMRSQEHALANVDPTAMMEAWTLAGVDPATMPPPPEDPVERFVHWVDRDPDDDDPTALPGLSLAALLHHVRTYWERRHQPNVHLFHYADLSADLPGQLRRLADALGVDVSDERLAELAGEATFARMQARGNELAPGLDKGLWVDNRAFFHSGSSGKWRDVVGPAEIERYRRRVAELVPPELDRWIHAGGPLDGDADAAGGAAPAATGAVGGPGEPALTD